MVAQNLASTGTEQYWNPCERHKEFWHGRNSDHASYLQFWKSAKEFAPPGRETTYQKKNPVSPLERAELVKGILEEDVCFDAQRKEKLL